MMRSQGYRVGIVLMSVGASAAFRFLLNPYLHSAAPMLVFVLAVAVSALTSGFAAGVAATILSVAVALWLFIEPAGFGWPAQSEEHIRIALFCAEGLLMSLLGSRAVHSQERLAREVQRRTAELQASRDELAKSNEALETFSSTISHDMRGPLRNITGFADILAQEHSAQLDEEGKDYLGRISGAAHRVEKLVHTLLVYARVSRSPSGPPEVVSWDRVVQEVLRDLRPSIARTTARVDVQAHLGEVLGHPETLAQATYNLIANAIKFTQPGQPPRVEISTEATNGTLRLKVRDYGIGVSPDNQERIFKPFERLHTRVEYEGTGLGLAIVAQAVGRMGGKAGMSSDGVSGSQFWIELPRPQR
jgi:signal transduction histidine kinase